MKKQQSNSNTNATRILTLAEHQILLSHVFETACDRVIIVSPFISNSAIKADEVNLSIKKAVNRGVAVSIYTDDRLNMTQQGSIKESAIKGIRMLLESGAKVYIVNGIHNKTLIRDDNLITEGSFNWLSAVRSKGATHQREERTMVIEGDTAKNMIEQETNLLHSIEVQTICIQEEKMNLKGLLIILAIGISMAAGAYFLNEDGWIMPIALTTLVISLLCLANWKTQLDPTSDMISDTKQHNIDSFDPNKYGDNLNLNVTNMFKNQ